MNIRHSFIAALLAGLGLISVAANAAEPEIELKIATMVPENSQWMKDMRVAGKVIEQRTDGRVKFKFYSGGTQGSEDRVLQKIRIGQLHGGTFAPTDFMKDYSDINIYGLPFVFASWDEMRYVRGQMDPALEKGFEDVGFVTFGFVGSFSMVLSNERINNHAAMKGKRLWLPKGDDISAAAMKKLELSPVPLPVADVYVSLQTGQLDIAAIPPEVAVALQWHTKVKYFTDMPVLYAMSFLAISKKQYDRLSKDDQTVLQDELRGVYAKINENAEAESRNALTALQAIGIQRVEPDEGQLEELQAIMSQANREMAEDGMFPVSIFEELQRHVREYRNRAASSSH